MDSTTTWVERRGQIERYFDRTAVQAWARLTSTDPVSRIRATVRAGRERMRATLLAMLPERLEGCRVLDAGCGTGALAVELARRGAHVLAIDLSPTLVQLAHERIASDFGSGHIDFRTGDFTDPALGEFEHVVAMDSLIHYRAADAVHSLALLAARCQRSMAFTFAPGTPLLQLMHAAGKLFPRADRSPAIVPVAERALRRRLARSAPLAGWWAGRSERVACGFYTSQALLLERT